MRWFFVGLLLLVLSVGQARIALASLPHTRSESLGPIVMTYHQLDQLVSSLRNQITVVNRASAADSLKRIQVEVVDATGRKVPLGPGGSCSLKDGAAMPEPGTSVQFEYRDFGMPVERVEISLNDYERKITVAGAESDQVDLIFSYVKDTLSAYVRPWQGQLFRFVGRIIAFIIGFLLLVLPFSVRRLLGTYFSSAQLILIQMMGLGLMVSILILPWKTLLPGFAVYSSLGGVDRAIGIAGLVSGILIALLGWLRPRAGSDRTEPHK